MNDFLLLIVFICLSFSQQNRKIPDGTYNVIFDKSSKGYENYLIKLDDTTYEKHFNDGSSKTGKLKWVYDLTLLFVEPKPNLDSMNKWDRMLNGGGPPIIIFNNSNNDTINFQTKNSGQLLVTINSGIYVRVK